MSEKLTPEIETIINELSIAYWMEMETVMNYIANSTNLDGVRAEEIKSSLAADVAEELVHAQTIAKRIKTIGGRVPGSETFQARQASLQPPGQFNGRGGRHQGRDRGGRCRHRSVQENHQIVRRCRLRDPRHVHHGTG